jgi:hypothetical protein
VSVEIPEKAYKDAAGRAGEALLELKAEAAKATHRPPRLDAVLAIRLARASVQGAAPAILEDRVEPVARTLLHYGEPIGAHGWEDAEDDTRDHYRDEARELLGLPATPDDSLSPIFDDGKDFADRVLRPDGGRDGDA